MHTTGDTTENKMLKGFAGKICYVHNKGNKNWKAPIEKNLL